MMDEVWCGLDMATDIAGLHHHAAMNDSFWPAFSDVGMVDMDASGFLGGDVDAQLMQLLQQQQQQQQHELMPSTTTTTTTSSTLSSSRSLSIDSGGSSFSLDAGATANGPSSSLSRVHYHAPASHHPFLASASAATAGGGGGAVDHDDAAIMRAMMAVISSSSSASPSSSASSPPPFCREDSIRQPAPAGMPRGGHVMVKSSLATPPGKAAPLSSGRAQQQQNEAASGNNQLYHMMSERKRREKLNDSFHTLRSLLPPCSKKDKTTVLVNAASYLKSLDREISELEEKNTKLEKHILCDDDATARGAQRRPQQRAKVQISKQQQQTVNLTVMVMVECDVVELVLHILECLRWMKEISVLSVDADTYSPQVLLKAIASIKLQIMGGDWNEALFHEAMTKAVNNATSSPTALTAY